MKAKHSIQHRGAIDGMTIPSRYDYIVYGSVRGLVSQHRSEDAAFRSLASDQDGCASQGGYSDAHVYRWTSDEWQIVEREYDD